MTIYLLIPKPDKLVQRPEGIAFALDVNPARALAQALPDPQQAADADEVLKACYREFRNKDFLFDIELPDGTLAFTTYHSDGVGDSENEWLPALVDLVDDIPNLMELLGMEIHWSSGFYGQTRGKTV